MADKPKKFDCRCPLRLKEAPTSFCPLAVLRLKALRNAPKELTEEEEAKLPGCQWALDSQLSNYCFFAYMEKYGTGRQATENEIAAMTHMSVATVKSLERSAMTKLKDTPLVQDLLDNLEGEQVVDEQEIDPFYRVIR